MNLRVFGKNTIIYAAGNLGARFGAFLLIPLYTHLLPLREYGLLSTVLITIQVMTIIMSLGTQKGFIRFAHECEIKNLMGNLLGSATAITAVGALVVTAACLALFIPFFRTFLHTNEVFGYLALACFAGLSQALFALVTSYYRAKNKGLDFVIASLVSLVLLIGTNIFFLLILGMGVKGVLIAQIGTYGSLWLFLFVGLVRKTGFGFSLGLTKRLLRFSSPLLTAMLWDLVVDTSGVYLLGYLGSLEQVAIYSLGYKIAQIGYMTLIIPFQLAYEPFVYGSPHSGMKTSISKLLTYLMLGYTFLAFGIVFMLRILLSLIAPATYLPASTVVFLMVPGIGFIGVYYVAESLLGLRNRTSLIGGVILLVTLGSLALNYLLIPLWGLYGVILVFNVTRISAAVISMIMGMKVFAIQLEKRRLATIGALFFLFLLSVFVLQETPVYVYYSVIPFVGAASLLLLYLGNFLDDREKDGIRGFLHNVRSRLLAREIVAD